MKSIPGLLIGSFLLVGVFGSADAPTVPVDPQEGADSSDETTVTSLSPSPRDAVGDVAGDGGDALVALTLGDDPESQSALAWAANGDQSGTPGVVSFADGLHGSPHPFLALSAGDLSSGALGGGNGAADAVDGRLASAGGFGFGGSGLGGSGFGGGSGPGGSGGSGSGGSDSPTQESLTPPGDTLVETPRAVPEPSTTFLLCAAGLGALAYLRARRRGSLARLTL